MVGNMKLQGIFARSELLKRFRESRSPVEQISVRPAQKASFEAVGWQVISVGKSKVRMQRNRSLAESVELQTWRVMYLCGFPHLSGSDGARLTRAEGVENQLDVVAYDDESAIVVECKSSQMGASNVDVPAELAVLSEHRNVVRQILNSGRERKDKLKVGGILVLYDVPFSDADSRRAADMKLTIVDAHVLQYYERLARLIGPAARFQIFGEVFEGQDVPGLSLKVPAVEFEMGGNKAYSFAIHPADLLKISFVAHRGRGDIETYQRMVSRKRLTEIAAFIADGGIFPTNIVINFQPQKPRLRLRFDAAGPKQGATPGSKVGYLTIPPIYQAAWIIDGQHRLLAYGNHRWAATASLAVTAFDGLSADKQAELFEKINSKQKKVSANLLAELFSTLHWNSSDQRLQVRAIASQVAQDLRSIASSPLHKRILSPDERRTTLRCITLTEFVAGLQRPGMFVRLEDKAGVRQFGVFWAANADKSRQRALAVAAAWFNAIRGRCQEMWDLGDDGDSGLVATNRGVSACLRVLGWVLMYLRERNSNFDVATDQEVINSIEPYARTAGSFFDALSTEEITSIRRHYGTGAPIEIAYRIGRAIRDTESNFEAEGLLKWMETKSTVDVAEAQTLCTDLERRLVSSIRARMKEEYGDDGWWREIPLHIRQEAAKRREAEPEEYPPDTFLYLIDLKEIVEKKWQLFQETHAIGTGSKGDKTKWLVQLNDIRRHAFHAGGVRLKLEDVELLKEIDADLTQRGI